jgi:hypothetical protein
LWPWVAGMVDIAAVWRRCWEEGDGKDSVDDCVLMFLGWKVEMLLSEEEGEKDGLAGDLIVIAEASDADARAAGCNLQVVNNAEWMVRPGRRSCEGIMTVAEPESCNCNLAVVRMTGTLMFRDLV